MLNGQNNKGEGLGLNFRARKLAPDVTDLFRAAQNRQFLILLAVPLIVVAGILIRRYFPPQASLPIVALAVLIITLWRYLTQRPIGYFLLASPVILVGVHFGSLLLEDRLFTIIVLSTITITFFAFFSADPLRFYQEWLFADPRISPERRQQLKTLELRPSLITLILFLAVIIVIPWLHSVTLAIAALVLYVLGLIFIHSVRTGLKPIAGTKLLFERARSVYRLYLAYPDSNDKMPGRWSYRHNLAKRRRLLFAFSSPFFLSVLLGLSFCVPWEIFGAWTIPHFPWKVPPNTTGGDYDFLLTPFLSAAQAPPSYYWAFVVALPLMFILPSLLLLACFLPAIIKLEKHRADVLSALGDEGLSQWDIFVERLRTSEKFTSRADDPSEPPIREADHFFLGFYPSTDTPALLHREILNEHALIVGQAGSGKTIMGLTPLITQILRGYHTGPTKQGIVEHSDPAPMLILDLKGDLALFNSARIEAARRGQRFLFFRLEKGSASAYFNPFADLRTENRTVIEFAELVVQALNLYHGDFYGASYYSRQHRDLLLTVLKDAKVQPQSWDELYALVLKKAGKQRHKDTTELLSTIHALTCYEQLRSAPEGKDQIHMPRLVAENEVAYFWLPYRVGNMSVKEVGKLALFAILTACAEYYEAGKPAKQTYVVIDEFQCLAAENIKAILQQARGFGISLVLALQALKDLQSPNSTDLRATVFTNTRFKQFFTVTERQEMEDLIALSGEELQYLQSTSESTTTSNTGTSHTVSTSQHPVYRPRLERDLIRAVNDAETDSLIYVTRGKGFTKLEGIPTRIQSLYPLDQDEYNKRLSTPWPKAEEVPTASQNPQTPEKIEQEARELHQDILLRASQMAKEMGGLDE